MIRAFWFFIQATVMIGGALWLLERQGHVSMDAFGYQVNIQAGLFLLGLAVLGGCAYFLVRMISAVLSIPAGVSDFFTRKRKARGYRDITRGFVALAAGDARQADILSRRVSSALPDEKGLALFLKAQSARLNGRMGEAMSAYEALLTDKEAVFLGLKGLLTAALDAKDTAQAGAYAQKALALYPKQGWVILTAYQLEIKNQNWDNALALLKRAEKTKAMTPDQVRSDRIALWVCLAGSKKIQGLPREEKSWLEKAYRADPFFVPVILRLARLYDEEGKKRKIESMVEKAFPVAPHPDLVTLWDRLAPQNNADKKDSMRRLHWYEKLVALNTHTDLSHLSAGQCALAEGLYGEARAYAKNAEKIQASSALYRLKARIEEKSGGDISAIKTWLEKASEPYPVKTWVCRQSGLTYGEWSPVALPHGSFNTMAWDYPGTRHPEAVMAIPGLSAPSGLGEAA
ncbi:MAG: hypothetical protein J0L77_03045 [Alphaproteobacteria bacterium]|nr:hypothetical protein [Alphaproteobacteria bacterium]